MASYPAYPAYRNTLTEFRLLTAAIFCAQSVNFARVKNPFTEASEHEQSRHKRGNVNDSRHPAGLPRMLVRSMRMCPAEPAEAR